MSKPTIIFTTKSALAAKGLKLVPASEWSRPSEDVVAAFKAKPPTAFGGTHG